MIDSAQRRVLFEKPIAPLAPGLQRLEFEIQGIRAVYGEMEETFSYIDLADNGLAQYGALPLTVWQRLRRRPSKIGRVLELDGHHVAVQIWSKPMLEFHVPIHCEESLQAWRECEIMALSAGYHFEGLIEPDPSW